MIIGNKQGYQLRLKCLYSRCNGIVGHMGQISNSLDLYHLPLNVCQVARTAPADNHRMTTHSTCDIQPLHANSIVVSLLLHYRKFLQHMTGNWVVIQWYSSRSLKWQWPYGLTLLPWLHHFYTSSHLLLVFFLIKKTVCIADIVTNCFFLSLPPAFVCVCQCVMMYGHKIWYRDWPWWNLGRVWRSRSSSWKK